MGPRAETIPSAFFQRFGTHVLASLDPTQTTELTSIRQDKGENQEDPQGPSPRRVGPSAAGAGRRYGSVALQAPVPADSKPSLKIRFRLSVAWTRSLVTENHEL